MWIRCFTVYWNLCIVVQYKIVLFFKSQNMSSESFLTLICLLLRTNSNTIPNSSARPAMQPMTIPAIAPPDSPPPFEVAGTAQQVGNSWWNSEVCKSKALWCWSFILSLICIFSDSILEIEYQAAVSQLPLPCERVFFRPSTLSQAPYSNW